MILPFAPPLEIAAAPLAEALPRVGAALGAPMRAAPALAEEIAVVRLDGATLAETKARFASAFSAEWRTESDGTLILTPDAARREVERRAWRAARRAAVAERLGALRRESRGHDFFDAPEAERLQREIAARAEREDADPTPLPTPARRLFARVLAGLRPEAFDGPEPVGRTVWTLTPNEFQRPLPPDARDALRDYREAVALWEATASREPDDSEPEARADPATRLLLTAARDLDGVTLTLIPIDSAGIAIESVEGYVSFDRPSPAGSPLPFRVPPAEAPTRDVALRVEPLTPWGGRILATARAAGRSMIVAPGDRLLGFRPDDTGDLGTELGPSGGAARFDAPGWMSVRTDDPHRRRLTYSPRCAWRRSVEGILRAPTLASARAYVAARPDRPYTLPADDLAGSILSGVWAYADLSDLRLAAALTPAEWRAAARGPLPIAALNSRAAAIARFTLYEDSSFGARSDIIACSMGWMPGWRDEPTNAIHPADALLRLSPETTLRVALSEPGGPVLVESHIYTNLARIAASGHKIPLDLDRARFLACDEWTLTLGHAGEALQTMDLRDGLRPLHAGTLARDRVPPAIRALLEPGR